MRTVKRLCTIWQPENDLMIEVMMKRKAKKELQQEIDNIFTTTLTEDNSENSRRRLVWGCPAREEINSTDTSRADLERKHLFEERIIEELSSPKRRKIKPS
jgi:hypothetical protein